MNKSAFNVDEVRLAGGRRSARSSGQRCREQVGTTSDVPAIPCTLAIHPEVPVTPLPPPLAAEKSHVISRHGVTLEDPFNWLRADNWQEVMRDPSALDPEIRAYLEAENAYSDAALADTDRACSRRCLRK